MPRDTHVAGSPRSYGGAFVSPGVKKSQNDYDWLGSGIYFWEYGADRALRFAHDQKARGKLETPADRKDPERTGSNTLRRLVCRDSGCCRATFTAVVNSESRLGSVPPMRLVDSILRCRDDHLTKV